MRIVLSKTPLDTTAIGYQPPIPESEVRPKIVPAKKRVQAERVLGDLFSAKKSHIGELIARVTRFV